MEVELGTVSLPFFVIPRIDGVAVGVSDIKSTYSNKFENDTDTPMSFFAELSLRDGTKTTVEWDESKSTDSVLYFPIADTIYATRAVYTVMFYWIVYNDDTPTPAEIEKIFTMEPMTLDVKELHEAV